MAHTDTVDSTALVSSELPAPPPRKAAGVLKFKGSGQFQAELKRRVDAYFVETGLPRRGNWQIWLKAFIILATLVASYLALLFVVQNWWQAGLVSILMGFAIAGVGLNIQHDGGHNAFSERGWVNKLMAYTLDLIGGSSYQWHWKHGVLHHTYTNITGHDTDIELGALGRLSPHQPRYWFHRFQHVYVWFLYCLMAVKWHLVDDYVEMARGKLGGNPVPRPRGWNLFFFFFGKAFFLTVAFVIPMLFHSFWVVVACYAIAAAVVGISLAVVFQLAHCVEEAEFPMPVGDPEYMAGAWAVHQVETTADFGRNNPVLCWLVGGLNFQIEHHLLPKICHIHFPALSKIVEKLCAEHGIAYHEHKSFAAGIGSHYRWLKLLGKPDKVTAHDDHHGGGASLMSGKEMTPA